jgi:asparagine synthase (glutamine-hydrolysing)
MCGIVGILRLNPNDIVETDRIERMRDLLAHRGPDGKGTWSEGPIGLGHRRLAIVDVAGGHQPMSNTDGSLWITFNGEIYNHAARRAELEARGYRYRSRSDTETILHLYEELGDRCVEQLDGMFAFAIWDRRRNRLLLARDRLGIKPLYYGVTEEEIVFASEIKAIINVNGIPPVLNEKLLPEFLASGFAAGSETLFRRVHKLLPGRTLTWSQSEGLRERRYWQVPTAPADSHLSMRDCAEQLRADLIASVRSHLMSDVPLGLFLSGGLDSSVLAALMAPMVNDPIRAFTVSFDDKESDESGYAKLSADSVGAVSHGVVVSPQDFFGELPRLVWHEDEPIAFPSSVPLHFVSRLAHDHGVKVVLTGEGADELFLGYQRYRVTSWNARLGRPLWALGGASGHAPLRGLVQRLPARLRRYADRTFLALDEGPRSLFFDNFAVFPRTMQSDLFVNPITFGAQDPYAVGMQLYEEASGGPLERASYVDLQTYLVELLMKQDQMSMAASIESRVPFLDHTLVERVVALPTRCKLHGWRTKAVLREAARDLVPSAILHRRKMGFPVPVGRWLRGPFAPLVDDLVLSPRTLQRGLFRREALERLVAEHQAGANHGQRLWLLANLELWQRIFLDGQDPSSLAATMNKPCAYSG